MVQSQNSCEGQDSCMTVGKLPIAKHIESLGIADFSSAFLTVSVVKY